MLILPFAYHVAQLNADQNCLRLAVSFKSGHQPYPPFDVPVILLNKVVQVLALPDGVSS
ncbi:protein of unknown function [Xenorhabdus poinarii G6]|uniref:Uncharacterized protein n=1 Tax=Xenorhabdus poinarii G6 TaxID=1354304 RepID=A0A068RAN9_9GAMM|nr:protein of unknown function [Xenorhabdus poinarii G6]